MVQVTGLLKTAGMFLEPAKEFSCLTSRNTSSSAPSSWYSFPNIDGQDTSRLGEVMNRCVERQRSSVVDTIDSHSHKLGWWWKRLHRSGNKKADCISNHTLKPGRCESMLGSVESHRHSLSHVVSSGAETDQIVKTQLGSLQAGTLAWWGGTATVAWWGVDLVMVRQVCSLAACSSAPGGRCQG